jgi:anti-sigma B factor antagonist
VEIIIIDIRGIKVLVPSGDIDMYTSPELRKELMSLIHKKVSSLIIDFKEVSYIDSSGIATFVEGLKAMRAYGGRLKFLGISNGIREIFNFSKLDKVFEIFKTIDDAINN